MIEKLPLNSLLEVRKNTEIQGRFKDVMWHNGKVGKNIGFVKLQYMNLHYNTLQYSNYRRQTPELQTDMETYL